MNHKAGQVIKTFGEPLKSTAITSLDDQTVLLTESPGFGPKQITVKALDISTGEYCLLFYIYCNCCKHIDLIFLV